ncbi:MAG: response regulator transcription factor [Planctomycetes bacterium]|nr:response regulator transcription factor [Planctomycetota bacterium]
MKILVVEDEEKLASIIQRGLAEEQNEVTVCADGESGLKEAVTADYDCIILDLMLPKRSGIELLDAMRAKEIHTPVIILTAKDSVEDRVHGLDHGADDYMVKPFAFAELEARIRSVARRADAAQPILLSIADVTLDPIKQEVKRGDEEIKLTSKEYSLLQYFMTNPNTPLSRKMIAENVWDVTFASYSNVIDVYVNFLRKKIDCDREQKLIVTVRGVGYMMRDPDRPID